MSESCPEISVLPEEVLDLALANWQQLAAAKPELRDDAQLKAAVLPILGLSDFVAMHLVRDPTLLDKLTPQTLENTEQEDYQNLLAKSLSDVNDEASLHQALRVFRNYHMVKLAWQDLLNLQPIEISLKKVSAMADALIMGAYNVCYQMLSQRYADPQGEFGPQPLLILGMGKLGGGELNFSSDIDLIFCYPQPGELTNSTRPLEHQQFFTKLAQKLIAALNNITADGQVFRVDMRLRPFGESGPLVMHFDAIEDYYQEQGREWERYAMVKARILNPASAYTEQLTDILKPFVFRRYLDYGAVDALRKMKSLISQEVRRRGLTDNIKLGQGGIREVEFIAQSFQLIKGGRETELQQTSLLKTIDILISHQHLPELEANKLVSEYLFLRKVEHCLQQFDDRQTQLLPIENLDRARLSHVMQCNNYRELKAKLDASMGYINEQFQMLVGDDSEGQQETDDPVFSLCQDIWLMDLDIAEMQELLEQSEICPQVAFFQQIQDFKQLIQKKVISQKGLDNLNILLPSVMTQIVQSCCISDQSDDESQLLEKVLVIIQAIIGRTTYLQLLNENVGAQGQLVKLCQASPWIAEQLSRYPILLDELLNPAELYSPTPFHEYPSELRQMLLRVDPDDLETQMETLRQFKQIQQLKIAAADVTGVLPIMQVSDHLTYLAEAIIKAVVNLAWQQMKEKYGIPATSSDDNKRFAVIGYGKLGGIELGYSSDLDLVFLHDCGSDVKTQGERQIESGQFYIKLAQRIMHLFMTKTPSGQLYEVDMRLRPSGNAGVLVTSIDGFAQYQRDSAWTWEHQALIRARVIDADADLANSFIKIRKSTLLCTRDPDKLKDEVRDMRRKMRDHLNKGSRGKFDLKQDVGGIADIEFLVQFWVLSLAHQHQELTNWSDNVRILEDLERLELIQRDVARALIDAYLVYRNASHRLTLKHLDAISLQSEFEQHQRNVEQIWQSIFLSH